MQTQYSKIKKITNPLKKIKKHHIVSALGIVVALAFFNFGGFNQLAGLISGSIFNSQPLFNSNDNFVETVTKLLISG